MYNNCNVAYLAVPSKTWLTRYNVPIQTADTWTSATWPGQVRPNSKMPTAPFFLTLQVLSRYCFFFILFFMKFSQQPCSHHSCRLPYKNTRLPLTAVFSVWVVTAVLQPARSYLRFQPAVSDRRRTGQGINAACPQDYVPPTWRPSGGPTASNWAAATSRGRIAEFWAAFMLLYVHIFIMPIDVFNEIWRGVVLTILMPRNTT